ncbi:hypothetical protein FRX31_014182 [Thalictrum thalictroides]|uniref:Uncharacterized protein n=1 Tax=Thalictrum thalictroides TaxID=46969 RepID=A0A7J6WJE0_THATH|nr:hypothetical protein FRX31_014182 [Thalictrum thalictroides]
MNHLLRISYSQLVNHQRMREQKPNHSERDKISTIDLQFVAETLRSIFNLILLISLVSGCCYSIYVSQAI